MTKDSTMNSSIFGANRLIKSNPCRHQIGDIRKQRLTYDLNGNQVAAHPTPGWLWRWSTGRSRKIPGWSFDHDSIIQILNPK